MEKSTNKKAFVPLLPYQIYVLFLYVGFFSWKYSYESFLIGICIFCCAIKITKWYYAILSIIVGAGIAMLLYASSPAQPEWFTNNTTYKIHATIESVTYKTGMRTQITLGNITATEYVDIQPISKRKPCVVGDAGTLVYTKVRSCAVSYPLNIESSLPSKAVWTLSEEDVSYKVGQSIEGVFFIQKIRGAENRGGFSIEEYWKEQGIAYRVTAKIPIQKIAISGQGNMLPTIRLHARTVLATALQAYTQESDRIATMKNAIVHALLLGDRYYFTPYLERMVVQAGIIHSLVLSGLHLSCLLLFAYPLVLAIIYLFPTIMLYIPKQHLYIIVLIGIAYLYASISGYPVSFVRAIAMLCCVAYMACMRQRYTVLDILFFAVFMVFCISPSTLYLLSFQLSVTAIIGIYCTMPYIQIYSTYIKSHIYSRVGQSICIAFGSMFLITLAMQVVLLPSSLSVFGTTSYLFISNIVWIPLLSFIVLPFLLIGFVLCLLGATTIGAMVLYYASYPIQILVEVLLMMNAEGVLYAPAMMRPMVYTTIALFLALYTLILVYGQKERGKRIAYICTASIVFLSIPIALRYSATYSNTLHVTLFDVGKGQALLLQEGNKKVLLDAGERTPKFDNGERVLSPLLTYNSFARLDSIILSHQDNDHIGGAIYLASHYAIGTIYYNGDREERSKTIKSMLSLIDGTPNAIVQEGDTIPVGKDSYIKVLLPRKEHIKGSSSNAKSIVGMLVYQERNVALLMGDIENAEQAYLVSRYGSELKTEIIVLPHHGSRHNMYPPLYDIAKPKAVISSTGKIDNNFLSKEVQAMFYNKRIPLYSTARHGRIDIQFTNTGMQIIPARKE